MKLRYFFFCVVTGTMLMSCGEGYRYHRIMEKELARGVRYDTLFLGMYLGMTKKDFYTHCWALNKRGLIRQGPGNASVYYKSVKLKDTVEMNFYPDFYDQF